MTPGEYYTQGLAICAACTVGVAVGGRLLLRAIGDSPARRVHGRYVYWWAVAGVAASGPLLPWAEADLSGVHGWAMFCMLAGWLVGTVHGGLVLLWRRLRGQAPEGQRG